MDRLAADRMFVAVMETGSFSAASRRIGTSSGQASKLVARLEAELGVRLLNRTTRAIAATEVGQAYFDRVSAILDEIDALDLSMTNAAQAPRGRLRLTAPLTFGITRLVPALNAFALRYPDIALDVQFSDRVVNLLDEGFDAAIRVGRPADSSLIARKLGAGRVVVVASDAYLRVRGVPLHPGDLARHDCIIDTNLRDPLIWPMRLTTGPVPVPVTGRLRYSNAEACLRAAEQGLGIARMPDFVAMDSLRAGRVRALLDAFADTDYGVYALYPSGRHLAVKVRVLVDALAAHFAHPQD